MASRTWLRWRRRRRLPREHAWTWAESLPDHVDRVHPVSTGMARQPCERAEIDPPVGSRRIDAHLTWRRRPAPLNRLEPAAEEDLDLGHLAVADGVHLDVAVALPGLERFVLVADDDVDEPVRIELRVRREAALEERGLVEMVVLRAGEREAVGEQLVGGSGVLVEVALDERTYDVGLRHRDHSLRIGSLST